jgi:hypothetical protein
LLLPVPKFLAGFAGFRRFFASGSCKVLLFFSSCDFSAILAFVDAGFSHLWIFFLYENRRADLSKKYAANRYALRMSEFRSVRSEMMEIAADDHLANDAVHTEAIENIDFGFLPDSLVGQCRRLIESYHDLHGYSCLPDILWKAGLGPFTQAHRDFRQLLRKASTTRSAKRSNDGFAQIATTLLSLEILASGFAGWNRIYPPAATRAHAVLKRNTRGAHTPLMDFYLYPPKSVSSAAIAALVSPLNRQAGSMA